MKCGDACGLSSQAEVLWSEARVKCLEEGSRKAPGRRPLALFGPGHRAPRHCWEAAVGAPQVVRETL
jgi:hypothetical protein